MVRHFLATCLECQSVGDGGMWVIRQHSTESYVGCDVACPAPCSFSMGGTHRTRRPDGHVEPGTGPHSLLVSEQGERDSPVRGVSDVDTLECYLILAPNTLL